MLRYVVIALIVIPALELIVIFQMGKLIGGWPTFGLMIVTGFLGAWLARREGLKVWRQAQNQLSLGQPPGDSIVDGICVFTGGILLLTPGLLTDVLGFLLVFPLSRPMFKGWIYALLRKMADRGNTYFFWRR
ncbi:MULTISPECIES: FxsA family protein [Paenibacillus]|uniref:FxsA family protein n=1 Tax=Paenibacillus TaxID=44249 RepID=UPI0010B8D0E2|nr:MULTISPECIES: FxsA family protein [Paenibacillus]GCL70897.1 membrane protein FxsA [Paenibacillus naphthalenovorans]